MQDFDGKNELCSHKISFFGERLLFAQQCERKFGGAPFGGGGRNYKIFLTYAKKIAEFLSILRFFGFGYWRWR